jgi:hypothetical protein
VAGELKPNKKSAATILFWSFLVLNISFELLQRYATTTGDKISTRPKDGFISVLLN